MFSTDISVVSINEAYKILLLKRQIMWSSFILRPCLQGFGGCFILGQQVALKVGNTAPCSKPSGLYDKGRSSGRVLASTKTLPYRLWRC